MHCRKDIDLTPEQKKRVEIVYDYLLKNPESDPNDISATLAMDGLKVLKSLNQLCHQMRAKIINKPLRECPNISGPYYSAILDER